MCVYVCVCKTQRLGARDCSYLLRSSLTPLSILCKSLALEVTTRRNLGFGLDADIQRLDNTDWHCGIEVPDLPVENPQISQHGDGMENASMRFDDMITI